MKPESVTPWERLSPNFLQISSGNMKLLHLLYRIRRKKSRDILRKPFFIQKKVLVKFSFLQRPSCPLHRFMINWKQ